MRAHEVLQHGEALVLYVRHHLLLRTALRRTCLRQDSDGPLPTTACWG